MTNKGWQDTPLRTRERPDHSTDFDDCTATSQWSTFRLLVCVETARESSFPKCPSGTGCQPHHFNSQEMCAVTSPSRQSFDFPGKGPGIVVPLRWAADGKGPHRAVQLLQALPVWSRCAPDVRQDTAEILSPSRQPGVQAVQEVVLLKPQLLYLGSPSADSATPKARTSITGETAGRTSTAGIVPRVPRAQLDSTSSEGKYESGRKAEPLVESSTCAWD